MQVNEEILQEKKRELQAQIDELEGNKRVLEIEAKQKNKQDRRVQRIKLIIVKEKILRGFSKSFPECSRFKTQIKYFDVQWDKWNKAKEDSENPLDYKTESLLIVAINKQFNLCKKVLVSDFEELIIPFRSKLVEWQNKVDKRLDKIEKG